MTKKSTQRLDTLRSSREHPSRHAKACFRRQQRPTVVELRGIHYVQILQTREDTAQSVPSCHQRSLVCSFVCSAHARQYWSYLSPCSAGTAVQGQHAHANWFPIRHRVLRFARHTTSSIFENAPMGYFVTHASDMPYRFPNQSNS
jgi:hypothetical protein